jgi:hypothetical protein
MNMGAVAARDPIRARCFWPRIGRCMASARTSWLEQADHIDLLLPNEAARVEESKRGGSCVTVNFQLVPPTTVDIYEREGDKC